MSLFFGGSDILGDSASGAVSQMIQMAAAVPKRMKQRFVGWCGRYLSRTQSLTVESSFKKRALRQIC